MNLFLWLWLVTNSSKEKEIKWQYIDINLPFIQQLQIRSLRSLSHSFHAACVSAAC